MSDCVHELQVVAPSVQGDDFVFMEVDNSYEGPRRTGYSSVVPLPEKVFRGSELEWDEQFERDVLSGKLDRLSKEAIKEHRAAIVQQERPKTGSIPDSADDQSSEGKPRAGRPRVKDALSGAERKKLWKNRHGEQALKKEREYQRDYRKRRKATRKYYLGDGK